jgi:hypothetical protein
MSTITSTTKPVFSVEVFGPRLARALDALLWMQKADARVLVLRYGDAMATQYLFTEPTGTSAFEADCLTRHYLTNGMEVSTLLAAHRDLRALIGDALDGLTLRDIRQLLWERCVSAE